MKLVYIGLREDTLQLIRESPELEEVEFTEVQEENFSLDHDLLQVADILLLGEEARNPIQLTQQVYSKDAQLSILLINDPQNYQKIKQSLLFTPFIGATVHSLSSAAGKGLATVVQDHIRRTRQRRNYSRLKSSIADFTTPVPRQVEKVKTDYINRVLEEAPVGLVLLNRQGNILSFNRYAASLFNKSEREVLGSPLASLFPEDLQPEMHHFFERPPAEQGARQIEIPSGEGARFLEIVLSSVEKNDSLYKTALIKDISDRIRTQKSIEEGAQKVKMILGSIPEMAWTALPNGEVDFLNQRWYQYTGQEPSAASWQQAIHPENLAEAHSLWNTALRQGTPYQLECRYLRGSDKSYRWHLTRALPVKNQEGKIQYWVGTCTDIQSLKDTEQELQKVAEELAASNEELTAANEEITASNEELHDMNGRLIRVNTDLDNFIYTASHDLKAPITNIEGLIQLLGKKLNKEDRESPQVQHIFGMINSSVKRFQRTISGLTEVVKLQRLAEGEVEQVQIAELIEDVKLDFSTQLQEAEARLEVQIEEDITVTFSRKNLKSILYNLLSNAIKYRSPERKPEIIITFYQEENFNVLALQDNGLGMEIKDPEKIFGMFKRMHSHVEGTGIGLYMVRKIIENEGGFIKVESQPGKGSTFKVYFLKSRT